MSPEYWLVLSAACAAAALCFHLFYMARRGPKLFGCLEHRSEFQEMDGCPGLKEARRVTVRTGPPTMRKSDTYLSRMVHVRDGFDGLVSDCRPHHGHKVV